ARTTRLAGAKATAGDTRNVSFSPAPSGTAASTSTPRIPNVRALIVSPVLLHRVPCRAATFRQLAEGSARRGPRSAPSERAGVRYAECSRSFAAEAVRCGNETE